MTTINIDNLDNYVVLYSKTHDGFHYCFKEQYKVAAELEQPGYDWEVSSSFETEQECVKFIFEAQQPKEALADLTVAGLKEMAASKGYPEADYKSLKKPELIEYLKSKED